MITCRTLRAALALDFVVVNAENAAGGFGLTEKIANEFFDAGADCLTLGDHAWDQREALTYIEREPRLLRPINYPDASNAPGQGSHLFVLPDGRRVGVIQAQGIVFMKQLLENPFGAVDAALDAMPLGSVADAVIVDMHCEAHIRENGHGPPLRWPGQHGRWQPYPCPDR